MINNTHHQVGVEPGSRLKRRSSERQKRSKGVQFEDQQAVATPWWNYPIKLMRGATNTNTTEKSGANSSKRRRRRHYTDPESRNVDDDKDENGDVKGWGGFEIPFFWPAAFFGQKKLNFCLIIWRRPWVETIFCLQIIIPSLHPERRKQTISIICFPIHLSINDFTNPSYHFHPHKTIVTKIRD